MRRLVKALLVRCGGADKLAGQMCDLIDRIEKHSWRCPAKWHFDVYVTLFLIMKSAA